VAWSTREIAELADTTVRAVRHYHDVGLLEEPERRANGYKQYGVTHLIRVLRIKRLTDLGFSLSQIAAMGDADEHPADALRTLDAELAATIDRLQRIRLELGMILRQAAPTDLPPEFAPAVNAAELSDADRSFLVVMSRVLGPRGLQAFSELLRDSPTDPSDREFDDLPADADEETRQALAERLAAHLRRILAGHPGIRDVSADAPGGSRFADRTAAQALRELYNPAQLDVMVRADRLVREAEDRERG
jgi:DNA-binding transcriptional MerR regulator